VIASDPVHADRMQRGAAKQVATADDQADLHTDANQLADFQCHAVQDLGVDTEILGSHERFTAQL